MGRFFPALHVPHKVHHALTVPVFQCDSAAHAQCVHPPNSVQEKAELQPLFYRPVSWGKSGAEKSPNCISQVTALDLGTALPHSWKEVIYAIKS